MALDEVLLEHAAALGRPVLRFYGWTEPAATFGYFQRHAEIAVLTPLRPLIRRPTGGGLVPHDTDWTYAVIVPPAHPWYALMAVESYRRMHEWLRAAFAELGLKTELAPCCDQTGPGRCFGGGWEQHDLLFQGRKLAGAAQRRNKLGLLIQGSVQPVPEGIERAQWEEAMLRSGTDGWLMAWAALSPDSELNGRADQLRTTKFQQPSYNQRR